VVTYITFVDASDADQGHGTHVTGFCLIDLDISSNNSFWRVGSAMGKCEDETQVMYDYHGSAPDAKVCKYYISFFVNIIFLFL